MLLQNMQRAFKFQLIKTTTYMLLIFSNKVTIMILTKYATCV